MPIERGCPVIGPEVPPRSVLPIVFKSLVDIPIRGGWGYTKEDAVVIDKHDPIVSKVIPFDGVGLEYVFVEKRIYMELIILREEGEKYAGIKWNLKSQRLVKEGTLNFDVLSFDVTALPSATWDALKAEWEGPDGISSSSFDIAAHITRRDEATIHYVAEYWFDITSFFGQR